MAFIIADRDNPEVIGLLVDVGRFLGAVEERRPEQTDYWNVFPKSPFLFEGAMWPAGESCVCRDVNLKPIRPPAKEKEDVDRAPAQGCDRAKAGVDDGALVLTN